MVNALGKMTLGQKIARRRQTLGLTRDYVARALGVSVQTVFNIENRPDYNIGINVLKRLGPVLGVEFVVEMKEAREMAARITMGNDEFILYIRKNYPNCKIRNDALGQRIAAWIVDNADGVKLNNNETIPAMWGDQAKNISEIGLPKSATQLEFNRSAMPALYDFLDTVGAS